MSPISLRICKLDLTDTLIKFFKKFCFYLKQLCVSGQFYHQFCTKTDNVYQFAMPECCQYRKLTVVWIDLSYDSSAKWISRISGDIKLNWWRHKWYRELDHSGRNMYIVDTQRLTIRERRVTCICAYSWPATDRLWLMCTGICRHW